jgi:FKBP-type peptidyl-prolyl cis-trans isomerase FklB
LKIRYGAISLFLVVCFALLALSSCVKPSSDDLLKNLERKESYVLGVDIARVVKSSQDYENQFDQKVFLQGFTDMFNTGKPLVNIERIREIMAEPNDSTAIVINNMLISGYVTPQQKQSYVFGVYHADVIASSPEAFNIESFTRGFSDEFFSKKLLLSEDSMNSVKDDSRKRIERLHKNAAIEVSKEEKLAINMEFLAQNKEREIVKTLPSGLQYAAVREGSGRQPDNDTTTVKVNYRAFFVDGREFDSSFKKGAPAELRLDESIPGWREGIKLMKEGGRYRFFVAPELAYGKEGLRDVPPDAVIIYDIELLEIIK